MKLTRTLILASALGVPAYSDVVTTIQFGTCAGGGCNADGIGTVPVTGPTPSTWAPATAPWEWISDQNTFVGGTVVPNGYADDFYVAADIPINATIISADEHVCADDGTSVYENTYTYYGYYFGFGAPCHTIDITSGMVPGHNTEDFQVSQLYGGEYGLLVYGSTTYSLPSDTVPNPTPEPATFMLAGCALLACGAIQRRVRK